MTTDSKPKSRLGFEPIPEEYIFPATETLGRSTLDAIAAAEKWLAENENDGDMGIA